MSESKYFYLLGQKEMELSNVRGSADPRWLPSEVKSFQISLKARASVCFAQASDLKWRSTESKFQAFSSQGYYIIINASRGHRLLMDIILKYYFFIINTENHNMDTSNALSLPKKKKKRGGGRSFLLMVSQHGQTLVKQGSAHDQTQSHQCTI